MILLENPKVKDLQRLTKISKSIDKYNIKIDDNLYPIPIDDKIYKQIETDNTFSFNIYSFEYNEEKNNYVRYPIYITDNKKDKHLNLLHFSNDDNGHYTLIKNTSRFFSDLTLHNGKSYMCEKCLKHFPSEESLIK